jgi:hypothetical protein
MPTSSTLFYTAFEGQKVLATGPLEDVALAMRRRSKTNPSASILLFSDSSGKQMDVDLHGSESELIGRLQVFVAKEDPNGAAVTGPGRPKLGVVAREISLLPRHWEWLATQSGGASATLRRLIEDARKNPSDKERVREAQERTHKFMTALAGDLPNYEEALRALYAKEKTFFQSLIRKWPEDIRDHSKKLSMPVWA